MKNVTEVKPVAAATSAGWWAGTSEEYFQLGPFASREDAIREARCEEYHFDGFHIIEAGTYGITLSARRLLDDQYDENAEDLFDFDHAEPDRRAGADEANAELQNLLNEWVAKWSHTFVAPNMFAWCRNSEYFPAEEQADA